jgi:hypothetical protein
MQTVPWLLPDGSPNIVRHPLNGRKQGARRRKYKRGLLAKGFLNGCRGEAWLVAPLACFCALLETS